MSALVYSEDRELAFQLLTKAREIASAKGARVYAISDGNFEDYFRQGADVVLSIDLDDFNVEGYRDVFLKAVAKSNPEVVLMGASKLGKELAPRIAAKLGVGCMNDCTNAFLEEDKLVVERLTYGGSIVSREYCTSKPTVITFQSRSFEKLDPGKRDGEVVYLKHEASPSRVEVLERREKPKSEADLENADMIISAGRGFRKKEDLKILQEVAEILGAQVGCTRPVSADLGWMDEWVGISGKKVKPSLYIACGISGTIQHVSGIRESKIIVSINKDEGAGIHGISDYSVIGDIYEVLPALLNAIKGRV